MIELTPPPSAFDKFVAALTTLYRRFSVQIDLAGTAFFTWFLAQSAIEQAEFLAHFHVAPWVLPPVLFIARSLLVATPQPKVLYDTAVKAEAKAEAKAVAKAVDEIRDAP